MPYKIVIQENILQDDMYYKDQVVLKYRIKYPKFISDNKLIQKKVMELNILYTAKALIYRMNNIMKLYKMAVEEYEISMENNYPIRVYESVIDYNITYNHNYLISLYFDKYEYTGGAHGNTIRYSDTWDIVKGRELELYEFFPGMQNYEEYILRMIDKQIAEDIKNGNNYYFEDYTQLVRENFNSENFYLEKDGIIIYYQQYEIAPYASGIRTFLIPYTWIEN